MTANLGAAHPYARRCCTGALRTRGGQNQVGADTIDALSIARDLANDLGLLTAYQNLKLILAHPRIRDTALNTLRALARECEHE